jgi:hypothetical protein
MEAHAMQALHGNLKGDKKLSKEWIKKQNS